MGLGTGSLPLNKIRAIFEPGVCQFSKEHCMPHKGTTDLLD